VQKRQRKKKLRGGLNHQTQESVLEQSGEDVGGGELVKLAILRFFFSRSTSSGRSNRAVFLPAKKSMTYFVAGGIGWDLKSGPKSECPRKKENCRKAEEACWKSTLKGTARQSGIKAFLSQQREKSKKKKHPRYNKTVLEGAQNSEGVA